MRVVTQTAKVHVLAYQQGITSGLSYLALCNAVHAKPSTTLKPWLNTVLGDPWRGEGDDLDDAELASMREPIGLDRLPPESLYLTGGADVQKDWIELTTLGWTADDVALVLAHEIVWGDPNLTDT